MNNESIDILLHYTYYLDFINHNVPKKLSLLEFSNDKHAQESVKHLLTFNTVWYNLSEIRKFKTKIKRFDKNLQNLDINCFNYNLNFKEEMIYKKLCKI